METLLEFQKISGLKVNTEKTKVVKVGMKGDNRKTCNDLNLEWTQTFTSLGITYDIQNMKEITDQNITNKVKEISKLIALWGGGGGGGWGGGG